MHLAPRGTSPLALARPGQDTPTSTAAPGRPPARPRPALARGAARLGALGLVIVLGAGAAGTAEASPFEAVSVEADPVFYVAAIPGGPAIDLNVDVRLRAAPRLRLGVLGWYGVWTGGFTGVLLTDDFSEDDWEVRWTGAGVEAQYRFRAGGRGGLTAGGRLQWNQYRYTRGGAEASAGHLVATPQVAYQWFPSSSLGLYLLPWAGFQLPLAGTDQVTVDGAARDTRKLVPIATVHIGWEL